jgi:hypothetical protein
MPLYHYGTDHAARFAHVKEATWEYSEDASPSILNGMDIIARVHIMDAWSNYGLSGFKTLAEAEDYIETFKLSKNYRIRDQRPEMEKLAEQELRTGVKTVKTVISEAVAGVARSIPATISIEDGAVIIDMDRPDGMNFKVYVQVTDGQPSLHIYSDRSGGELTVKMSEDGLLHADSSDYDDGVDFDKPTSMQM